MTEYEKVEHKDVAPEKTEAPKVVDMVNRQKLQPVVKNKKKGVLERLVIGIIGPDGIPAIGSYLNKSIIIPAVKDVIVNSISSGIEMMMYGPQGERPQGYQRNYSRSSSQRPYYSSRDNQYYSNGSRKNEHIYQPIRSDNNYIKPARPDDLDTSDFPIDDRNQALEVLSKLVNQGYKYGFVTLDDFYSLMGIDSSFTDQKWGWYAKELDQGTVVRANQRQYAILLPDVKRISN